MCEVCNTHPAVLMTTCGLSVCDACHDEHRNCPGCDLEAWHEYGDWQHDEQKIKEALREEQDLES